MEALLPSVQLPALAQLMKLRRAGVYTWRCTKDGATHELLLRPLPTRWRAARRTVPHHRASQDEGAAAAIRSPRRSRGARRRSNIAEKKRRAAMCLQRFARGMIGRVARRKRDIIKKEALATKAVPKKNKRKPKAALIQPGMRTTTRTLATLALMRRARGKQRE